MTRPADLRWLGDLLQDMRVGSRALHRTPIVTTVAVVTLACAIGANTAIFSLLHMLVLRDLPVREPASLVQFLWTYPGDPPLNFFSLRDYEHYRDDNRVFSAMLGTASIRLAVQRAGGVPETLGVECVTGNYFVELGVRSEAGRVLDQRDGRPDAPVVAVVSSSYWNVRVNRSPQIVGTNMTLTGDLPVTVVGVAEPRFSGLAVGYNTDIWIPATACGRKGPVTLGLVARLKAGVSIEQAQAGMRVLDRARIEEFAKRDPRWRETTLDVVTAHAGLSTPVHQQFVNPLFLLMGVVGVLLVLACANLGSVLLARGAARQQEMAVRVSLGAGRLRVVRQLLIESLMLSVAGGLIGAVAAYLGARGLMTIMTGTRMVGAPPRIDVVIDGSVLGFTAFVMALATLLFGLVPAWTAFVSEPAVLMRPGREAARPGSRTFGNALVVAQVALSVALVTVAALAIDRLSTLRDARSLGFDPSSVLLVTLDAGGTPARQSAIPPYKTLLDRIESMPGVVSATLSGMTPMSGAAGSRFVNVDGFREDPQARRRVSLNIVTPGFFETYRTPLVAGRDFRAADEGRSRVAIINQTAARYYFSGRNPLGAHFQFDDDSQPYEIVGVVADAKYSDVRVPAPRTIYLHRMPQNRGSAELSVRTDGPALALAADVRRLVSEGMPGVSITKVTSLAEQVDASVVPERFIARLSSFFGSAGMLLAAVGLYGLLAFTVARRTREVGVRIALGAQQRDVMILVLRRAFALVAVGLIVGTPVAFIGGRMAANAIGGVATTLPMVVAILATLGVTLVAAYVPARRATRVDPLVAMRAE
jgi:putative ABC transport system permease protein